MLRNPPFGLRRRTTAGVGPDYDRLVINRTFLLWLHVVLGVALGIAYVSTLDYSHFRWWSRWSQQALLIRCFVPVVPYLISVIFSRRVVTQHRIGVVIFTVVLVAGTVAAGYCYISRFSDGIFGSGTLAVVAIQIIIYILAAIILLVDWRSRE